MTRLLRFLACLPLPWMQRVGALLGWLVWVLSPAYRRHFKAQSTQAGYRFSEVRAAVAAAGCQTLESFRVWFGAPMPVSWDGLQHIEAAYAKGQGVVFLTPHLGCYEITTDGVRQLIKALRRGEAIGLLPDQVPPEGMGMWSQMWGRDAYTMTLGARLALQTQAEVVIAWGERLPHAKGYCIHVEPLGHDLDPDLGKAVRQLNHAMERLIRQSPGQYLWGYGRFKQPRQEGLT